MPGPITEKFSEKPQRGRPRVLEKDVEEALRRGVGFYKYATRRSNLNEFYMWKAFKALWSDNPEGMAAGKAAFAWFGDPDTEGRLKRSTILTELGRLGDPEAMRRNARIICDQKMRTREAVVRLRQSRAKPQTGSITGLCDELIAHLNDYWLRHPEFTVEQFLDAIQDLRWAVEDRRNR
jgi:hypothetical protein